MVTVSNMKKIGTCNKQIRVLTVVSASDSAADVVRRAQTLRPTPARRSPRAGRGLSRSLQPPPGANTNLDLSADNTSTTTTTSVRETLLRRRLFFLLSIIPSCQCFPFTSSSFAAFVARCTLVTPVYTHSAPLARSCTPCRSLASVGHFWRPLPRRRHSRQHNSAPFPDLLNYLLPLLLPLHLLLLLLRVVPLALFVHF